MLKFLIVQLIKDKGATIRLDWSEDQILSVMKDNMPKHMHQDLEKAWNKTVSLFKKETIKL